MRKLKAKKIFAIFMLIALAIGLNSANVVYAGDVTGSAGGSVHSYSGYSPAQEMAEKAFDNNIYTKWLDFDASNSINAWIIYDLGGNTSRTIDSYSLTSANDHSERDPRSWTLYGKNNNPDKNNGWTSLDSVSNHYFSDRHKTDVFKVDTNEQNAYRYYKLVITKLGTSNATEMQVAEIELLDTIAPTSPTVTFNNNYISSQTNWSKIDITATINASASTDANGVKSVEYRLNSGGWNPILLTANNFKTLVNSEGENVLEVKSTDNYGNQKSDIYYINIDKTLPVINPSIATASQANSVTVTANATDAISGIKQLKWASGEQAVSYFTSGGTVFTNNFNYASNGMVTIYAEDNAGNKTVSTLQITTIIDKIAPVINLNQTPITPTSVNVTATVTDTGSGVAQVKYLVGTRSIDEFNASGVDITSTLSFVAFENGIHTVYARDVAGNAAIKTIIVTGIKGQLAYDSTEFIEVEGNTGQIENKILLSLSGDAFKNQTFNAGDEYTIGTIPSGLTFKVTRLDNTTLELSFTGTASAHEALNSRVFNLIFTNNAYNNLTASTVVDNTKSLSVRFANSPKLNIESGPFTESDFNDGSIAGTKSIILTGTKFTSAVAQSGLLTVDTHYTVSGVPAGLTVEIIKESDARLTVKLVGKATNHAVSNNITNLNVTLKPAAFATALNPPNLSNNFAITFIGKNPIRVLEIYPSTIFTSTDGDFKDATSLNNVDYQVTSMSLNKFISLKEDVNGLYDVVYFGRGQYAASSPTLDHFGNDITNLAAVKIKNFIASGQLVIFHTDALKFGLTGKSYTNITTNMVTHFKPYTDNPTTYKNVVTITDHSQLSTALIDNVNSVNLRPVLSMLKKPFSYKDLNLPLDKNIIEFTFIASDKESTSVSAKLYIDRDNDGLFDSNEIVETHIVNKDKTDTFYYTMPTGLTGVYFWKLIVTDDQGASNEIVDVFYLKGDQINVNVLQVMPTNVNPLLVLSTRLKDSISGNLAILAGYTNPADSLGYKYGEYKINVTTATMSEFNNPPAGDTRNLDNLNGNYNMILFGFADSFAGADFDDDAAARVKSFLNTKQSVMFTHDMIMFNESLDTLKDNFLGIVGQNTNRFSAGHIARYPSGYTSYNSYNLAGYAGFMNTGDGATTSVSKVNTTAMSLYPFNIEAMPQSSMSVAKTHYQYYKLDLENPNLVPVFNLYRPESTERYNQDAMNNYYTYSIGNMTYSGTGHSGGFPDYELMMFVNTMIKAYSSSNHAPNLVVYEPVNNTKLDYNQPKFKLSFRAYDYDDGDEQVFYKVFIDQNNSGTFEQIGTEQTINRGELTELDITKPFSDIRAFKIKVEVRDDQDAKAQTEILLYNTDIPKVTPQVSINDSVYFVGESITVQASMIPSGKVAPDMMIDADMELYIPAGVEYNGVATAQTLKYLSIPAYTFTATGSTTPTWTTSLMTMVAPTTPGNYAISAKSTYTLDGQPVNPQPTHQQSFAVVQGQVEVQVVDTQGNPMKNIQIIDKGVNTGQQTLDGGRIMLTPVSRGEHIYTITAPSGYVIEKTEYSEATGTFATGNTVTLTNTAYSWKVKFTVKLNITVPIEYYHVLPNNDVRLIGSDDGTGATSRTYDLRTKKGSLVRIAALVDIPLITGNEIKELTFEVSTLDKDGNTVTAEYQARVVGLNNTAWPFITSSNTVELKAATSRLIATNTTPPGGTTYAGHEYYVIIEIPKADTQKFWISKLNFKMSNNSVESIYNSKVSVISIKDLSIPVLK